MIKNKKINLGVIKKVALALGELNERAAYVGGAVVSIYADDPAADDVRPTKDLDLVLHIVSFGELTAIQEKLGQMGIFPDPNSKIICRFTYDDVLIDVMSTQEVGWAPSNPWFDPGFRNMLPYRVDEQTTINVFPVSYFLATKFSAFHDRGGDPRTSRDFEDIVYVVDNRLGIVKEISESPSDVREYLKAELRLLLANEYTEGISAHLSRFSTEDRLGMLMAKISAISA